jgi:hypothetical protein
MLKAYWPVAAGVATVVGMGVAAVACGSSASNAGIASHPAEDAGADAGEYDGGFVSPDARSDADADAAQATPPTTSALFVNAMPSALSLDSAVRLCWGTPGPDGGMGSATFPKGDAMKPFPSDVPMPESNYPGIPLGGAVLLADASVLEQPVVLVAIRALTLAQVAPDDTCFQIFNNPSPKLPSTDYFVLSTVSLPSHLPSLVAISGCAPLAVATNATTQACGAQWDSTYGNLHASVLNLAPSSGTPGTLDFQVAQLSPAIADQLGDGGLAEVWFGTMQAGGSEIAAVGQEGDLAPVTPHPVLLDGSLASYDGLGFSLVMPGADGGTRALSLSLSQAQELMNPTADPASYYGGAGTYVVALVGDPAAPPPFSSSADGGIYDGTGLHFLVAQTQGPN